MACGCGKAAAGAQFEVTMPDGTVKTTDSQVQAAQWAAKGGVMREKTKA